MQLFVVISIILDFILTFFLVWLNRRLFVDIFKSISRKTKVILFLIVAIFSIVVAVKGFNFKAFIPSDEEWELMRQAKEFLNGGQIFDQLRYGMVYPSLLAFGFQIFGVNPLVASVMTFVLGVLSIFLIFIISQLLFKNEKISLISTGMYSFSPLLYIFTTLQMGYPGLVSFFLLLFVLVSVLGFQNHKTSLYALSLILIAVTAQIKPEYFILIVPYVLCFILFKEYKHIRISNLFILIILFLILISPYLIQNARFKESYVSGWCSPYSMVGNTPIFSHFLTDYIDPVIKKLINNRFSINYFVYKIPSFFQFWTFRSLAFISPVILLGIIVALKKHVKMTIYLLAIFFSITFLYLSDCPLYDTRFIFPTFGLIVIFFGLGIYYLINLVGGGGNGKQLLKNLLLLLFSFLMMISLYFYEFKNNMFEGNYPDYLWVGRDSLGISNNLINLDQLIIDLPKINTKLFVPDSNEENYLILNGFNAISLSNIEALNSKDISKKFVDALLPLDQNKINYYLELNTCNYEHFLNKCNYVRENYILRLIRQSGENDRLYRILSK